MLPAALRKAARERTPAMRETDDAASTPGASGDSPEELNPPSDQTSPHEPTGAFCCCFGTSEATERAIEELEREKKAREQTKPTDYPPAHMFTVTLPELCFWTWPNQQAPVVPPEFDRSCARPAGGWHFYHNHDKKFSGMCNLCNFEFAFHFHPAYCPCCGHPIPPEGVRCDERAQ